MKHTGKFGLNVLLVVLSLLVSLAFMEGLARFIFADDRAKGATQDPLQAITEFDPVLSTRYRSGVEGQVRSQYGEFEVTYRINELGLRDRPLASDAQDSRVLVLGNSFVEGWGVEADQAFLSVWQSRINEEARHPIRFVNAGISGFGVAQSYLFGKELMDRVKPAAVVFVYASTMVQADFKYLSMAEVDHRGIALGLNPDKLSVAVPGGQEQERPSTLVAVLSSWGRYSALAHRAHQALVALDAQAAIKPGDPASDLLAGLRADPDVLPKLHEASLRHVAALVAMARERNLPFVLIHLPLPHQLSADVWQRGRTAYSLEPKVYEAPDRTVVENFCRQHSIRCWFPHDALRDALSRNNSASGLYYVYDFHPTAAGNQVLGEWLADRLDKHLQDAVRGRM